jgi:sodium-dependent dicarboxylate transporter 2/3/5
MWISNTATAILMYTIALALVALVERDAGEASRPFGRALMLGIAYAASIGGTATLIGTPTNALLASFLADSYGYTIDFHLWLAIGVPYAALMLPFAWLWLTRVAQPVGDLDVGRARRLVDAEAERLGPWSREEKAVAVVFAATALGWIGRHLLAGWTGLPITDTTVAMTGGLALLVVPLSLRRHRFALDWATVEALPWGVLILFGGGLALAAAFQSSGLAAAIGHGFARLGGAPAWVLVLAVTAVVVGLTELTSNTATAATFLPVVGAAAAGMGASPLLLTVPVAIAASAAFMLPVATPPNAIVFAYRHLRIADMARSGLALNLVAIAVITLLVLGLGGPVLGIR